MVVRYPRLNVIFSERATTPPPPSRPEPKAAPPAPPHLARYIRDGLAVDLSLRSAIVEGRELDLTYLEFELLAHLVANPLRVHSRQQLMENVWGRPDNGDTRTISTHIARIRRKLGPVHGAAIATVRQIGYKYDPRLTAAGPAPLSP
ncbi:winged helix-turn-helix domain-containing protein [Kitasatospora sp. NPDC056138]|uniref:winged helix-turn-helix domain-containing protein n=1 Tax=Kitasatospora sp. NPDC056138 TaxID=3345724 RepID=UPI0035DB8AA2